MVGLMITAMIIVIPLAIFLSAGFVVAFIVAAGNGQFDDLETPAHRVLFDESSSRKDNQ